MTDAALAILKRVFPQLGPEALSELYGLGRVAAYPRGQTLCREGEVESVFYVLVEGTVEVFKQTDQGPRRINTMSPGEYFGELALLVTQARTSTIVTAEDVTVIEIDRDTFERCIRPKPDLLTALSQIGVARLLRQESRLASQLPDPTQEIVLPQIFVSYAHADQPFVDRLVSDLSQRGFRIWQDRHGIKAGTKWDREIEKALDDSRLMIVVLSSQSVESPHVADEWNFFLEENKPVLPVVYEACRIPFRLRRIQYVNFAGADYSAALQLLTTELQTRLKKS